MAQRAAWRRGVLAGLVLLTVLSTAAPAAAFDITAVDDRADVYYVARGGRDTDLPLCSGGTEQEPWGSITFALSCLTPGDRLYVRGGTYHERVLTVVNRARPDAPILVTNYPGERPVIRGLLRLEMADHWTLDGINVTSDDRSYGSGEYLVKMRGGVGWTYRNAEIWNARSYAAFRVEPSRKGPLSDWTISENCIHDTHRTHTPWQDHNVYVDTGFDAGPGRIERNLIFNAHSGFNVKLGPGAIADSAAVRVTVRFNTIWNGVQNILASGGSHSLRVERNLFGGVIRPRGKSFYPHIRGFQLSGGGNVAKSNFGTDAGRLVHNDRHSRGGWRVSGSNRAGYDPKFDTVRSCQGFRPTSTVAYTYGRWAPPRPAPRPISSVCPGYLTDVRAFRDVEPGTPLARMANCAAFHGLFRYSKGARFDARASVTRAQLATLVARVLERSGTALPTDVPDAFWDDAGSVHETSLNRLAAAGVFVPARAGAARPTARVDRAELASTLARAFAYRAGEVLPQKANYFVDDNSLARQADINRVTAAGLVTGVRDGYYGPGIVASRGQTATVLVRLLDLLLEEA